MYNSLNLKTNVSFFGTFVVLLLLFLINPFITILLTIFIIILFQSNRSEVFYSLFILLSLYLGAINATKLPESDLGNYYDMFQSVKDFSFIDYVFFITGGKEILFNVLTFLLYYLLAGSFSLYILTLTFLIYMFQFTALYKFFHKVNDNPYNILLATCLLAFFTQYFNLTAHLVRQMLAVAILMYCIVDKSFNNKNNYILLGATIFIHTSIILFIPLIYIKTLRSRIVLKRFIIFIGLISLILLFGNVLINYLIQLTSSVTFLNFIFVRVNENDFNDITEISLNVIFGITIPLMIIAVYKLYFYKLSMPEEMLLYNIYIILGIFIILMSSVPLLQYRYFYITYSFIPYLISVFFIKGFGNLSDSFKIFIILFILIRFFFTFSSIVWKYAPLEDILINNYFSILTTKYW